MQTKLFGFARFIAGQRDNGDFYSDCNMFTFTAAMHTPLLHFELCLQFLVKSQKISGKKNWRIISAPTELTENIAKTQTFANAKTGGAEPHPYEVNKECFKNRKRSQALERADNIRPYGANKDYSKKNKRSQVLNLKSISPSNISFIRYTYPCKRLLLKGTVSAAD